LVAGREPIFGRRIFHVNDGNQMTAAELSIAGDGIEAF
jgi:hypothetical protein